MREHFIRRGIYDTKERAKAGTTIISSINEQSFNVIHLEIRLVFLFELNGYNEINSHNDTL